MARLRAGEAQLEAGEDAALGRTRSLAASLSYGFAQAFTDDERARLAVLHLFRDTADVDALRFMGDPDVAGEDAVPELAGLDRDAGIALLDRAADIGLLDLPRRRVLPDPPRPALVLHHPVHHHLRPARPARPPSAPPAPTPRPSANSATTTTAKPNRAATAQVVPVLRAEEANLRHALDLARARGLWDAAVGCLQGLRVLYQRTGRDGEWARLVAAITPDFTDPATGGPLPGREDQWSIITGYRVRLAQSCAGLARRHHPPERPHRVAPGPGRRGAGRPRRQPHPGPAHPDPQPRWLPSTTSATSSAAKMILAACRTIRRPSHWTRRSATARRKPRTLAASATPTCAVPGLRDLDQAEHWFRHSLSLRPDSDRLGRARCLDSLGCGRPGAVRRRPGRGRGRAGAAGAPQRRPAQLPAGPGPHPRRRPRSPRNHREPARQHLSAGPGTPARRCATTSNPSSTRKPAGTSTQPGRPATTSPSCSPMTAGPATRCTTRAPPCTTSSRPGPAQPPMPHDARRLIADLEQAGR